MAAPVGMSSQENRVRNLIEEKGAVVVEESYHRQSVELVLDRESEVYQRLAALSAKTGKPIDELFDWAVGLGIEEHLRKTVGVLERVHS